MERLNELRKLVRLAIWYLRLMRSLRKKPVALVENRPIVEFLGIAMRLIFFRASATSFGDYVMYYRFHSVFALPERIAKWLISKQL